MFKREFFNDVVQFLLKFFAFYSAPPSQKSVFFAELVRSSIDFGNHLCLYFVNFVNDEPTKTYPYGIGKVKNVITLIPSAAFIYFGIMILYDAVLNISSPPQELESDLNTQLYLYLISMGIELSVVYKNFSSNMPNNQVSFENIKNIILQKSDPLLQTIILENVIAIISTIIPLAISCISYFSTSNFIFYQTLGVCTIGIFQVFIGGYLGKSNWNQLIGEKSIDNELRQDVLRIILNNSCVDQVKEFKAVQTGINKFRISCVIYWNLDRLQKKAVRVYQDDLNEIYYGEFDKYSIEKKEMQITDLMNNIMWGTFEETNYQQTKIIHQIVQKYPQCQDTDFEREFTKKFNQDEVRMDFFNEHRFRQFAKKLKQEDIEWIKTASGEKLTNLKNDI